MNNKNKSKKIIILIILLLPLAIIFFAWKALAPTLNTTNSNTSTANTKLTPTPQIEEEKITQEEPEQIIKCQRIVVSPTKTIELFAYFSGRKIKLDYRIAAATEADAKKTQILYDGDTLYAWNPPFNYGGEKPANPDGLKGKTADFKVNIDTSVLDEVKRFSAPPYSGDFMCKIWDEGDYVFDLPDDFKFNETTDINTKVEQEIGQLCDVCAALQDATQQSECKQNLGCEN